MTFVCLIFSKSSLRFHYKKKRKKTIDTRFDTLSSYKNANELFRWPISKISFRILSNKIRKAFGKKKILNLEEAEKLWLNIFFTNRKIPPLFFYAVLTQILKRNKGEKNRSINFPTNERKFLPLYIFNFELYLNIKYSSFD